ncbi:thioredoxin family protein [Hwangdonia sp.]|uniref:thioredoxin family protein n=1 Tax=Hwangdonia sp. TaxID=1883432 RepID=UPI003AB2F9A3
MKNIILTIVCLIGLTTIAQNRKIEFIETDWKSHLASAKKSNKLIFFDAYTSWCAPCKVMARDVFSRDEVADLFNKRFINAKYDMEKGEGITLKDKYGISAYPTYLFINGDGEVVHKIVGSMGVKEFINEANNALNTENTIYALSRKFESSGYSETSAIAYLKALKKAYESDKMSIVSKAYFDSLEKSLLFDEHHWELVVKYLNNPSSKAFSYLYRNKRKLEEQYGTKEVNRYFQQVFSSSVYRVKKAYSAKKGIKDAKQISKSIKKLLKKENSYSNVLLVKLGLIELAASNEWDEFSKKVDAIFTDDRIINKSYVVIEAANDIVNSNQENQYGQVLNWANLIEEKNPELFTQIQLAELRKRVLKRQGKMAESEAMAIKEKRLRKEAAEKRLVTPPLMKD